MVSTPVGMKFPKSGSPSLPHARSGGEWGEFAEDLGYESIWCGEGWGTHAFVDLTHAVCRTSTLTVGTSIASVYSKTPADLAMAAGAVSRISGGRFVLGLGTSHPGKVGDIHGLPFERPVRRVGEAMELIKRLLSDEESVSFEGEIFESHGCRGLDEPVPVYNAAQGPMNLRLTGRVADGWLPYLLPLSRIAESFDVIATAAEGEGRSPDDITTSPQILAAVSEDPEEGKDVIRSYVADYLGDKEEFRSNFESIFPDEVSRVVDAWERGDRREALDSVTDPMLEEVSVTGTPEAAREQLREVIAMDVIDRPIVYAPHGTDLDMLETTYRELSPNKLDEP